MTTGQSATLSWSVNGATSLRVDGLGAVTGSSVQVAPAADTTYVLTASNEFGSTQAQVTLPVYPPPTTWFAPIGDLSPIPYVHGAVDYLDLFTPSALWSTAASHVAVFKMYTQYLLGLDDATLSGIFADLKRRHIAFALESGPLTPEGGCGIAVEGFGGPALQAAQRIQALGGTLHYVAFDEPAYFGGLYSGTNACGWTPLQIAQNAAGNVAQIRSVFPDVVVGDIEPFPGDLPANWLSFYEDWIDAWQAVTGKPLAFFDTDVQWDWPGWPQAITAMSRALAKRRIPIGHIYNGLGKTSDATWMLAAEQNMTRMETHVGEVPDQAIFQSWESYPKHLLPETDPTAMTYAIDQYFRTRTSVSLAHGSGALHGTLQAGQAPIAGATVTATLQPAVGAGQLATYMQTGVLPANTNNVVFGARVGIENCANVPLPAEFYLTDFTLDAGAAGKVHADFSNGLNGWGTWGNASIAQVEGSQFHARVLPGQSLGLNTVSLPFAAAGSAYTLTIHATIPAGSSGNGCAVSIYLDATPKELSRDWLLIAPQPSTLGTAQTAADGSYSITLAGTLPAAYTIWADAAGTTTYWSAAASVVAGAPLAAGATSLPSGSVGVSYRQVLGATGGNPPHLWASAGLPPGLSLAQDGMLSGTPTVAGTYSVSVSVVDYSDPVQVVDLSVPLVIE